MIQGSTISVVTRFMDRLHHLKQSFPSWLKIPGIDELLIVDWSSKKDNLREYLSNYSDPRITLVSVENEKYFNRGKAFNVGIHLAQSEYIFIIDCDVITVKNPLESVILDKYTLYRATSRWTSLCGTCIFPKKLWHEVGGYAEYQEGWGHDDDYLHAKLVQAGCRVDFMNENDFLHIEHGDEERTIYHKEKSIWVSRDKNRRLLDELERTSFDDYKAVYRKNDIELKINIPSQQLSKYPEKKEEIITNIQKVIAAPVNPETMNSDLKNPGGMKTYVLNPLTQKSRNESILSFPRPKRM